MAQLNKIDMLIGGRVRLRRIQLGMERTTLAASANISIPRLQAFEAGRERIGAQFLADFASALGVPPAYFFQTPKFADSAVTVLMHKN